MQGTREIPSLSVGSRPETGSFTTGVPTSAQVVVPPRDCMAWLLHPGRQCRLDQVDGKAEPPKFGELEDEKVPLCAVIVNVMR